MKDDLKRLVKRIPVLGGLARAIYRRTLARRRKPGPFPGSSAYWEGRYAAGGNSGAGSYSFFAEFKAEVLNGFVARQQLRTVIEFGCGDGNQLLLATYPEYTGYDVSHTALQSCRALFGSDARKSFRHMSEYAGEKADLTLSLDVIYHLVEDPVFEHYMGLLFDASSHYVIIYSSNTDDNRGYEGSHIRHRQFTRWIEEHRPGWKLLEHLPNRYPFQGDRRKGSFADFFIFEKA